MQQSSERQQNIVVSVERLLIFQFFFPLNIYLFIYFTTVLLQAVA